jgi:hypothetical protein
MVTKGIGQRDEVSEAVFQYVIWIFFFFSMIMRLDWPYGIPENVLFGE